MFLVEMKSSLFQLSIAAKQPIVNACCKGGKKPIAGNTKHHLTTRRQTATPSSRKTSQFCGGSFCALWSLRALVESAETGSGSESNLISMGTLQELKYQGLKIALQPCIKKSYAYGGWELEAESQFQSEVSVAKTKIVVDFIVVNTGRCLLGYAIATSLGIPRVGPAETFNTGNCNTVDDTFVGELKAKCSSVSQGIGKLKDFKLKLYIYTQICEGLTKPLSVRGGLYKP